MDKQKKIADSESEMVGLYNQEMKESMLSFGIQECSKCKYKLRCDECVYNEKDMNKIVSQSCVAMVKRFAEMLKKKTVHYSETPYTFDFEGVTIEDIDETCDEIIGEMK